MKKVLMFSLSLCFFTVQAFGVDVCVEDFDGPTHGFGVVHDGVFSDGKLIMEDGDYIYRTVSSGDFELQADFADINMGGGLGAGVYRHFFFKILDPTSGRYIMPRIQNGGGDSEASWLVVEYMDNSGTPAGGYSGYIGELTSLSIKVSWVESTGTYTISAAVNGAAMADVYTNSNYGPSEHNRNLYIYDQDNGAQIGDIYPSVAFDRFVLTGQLDSMDNIADSVLGTRAWYNLGGLTVQDSTKFVEGTGSMRVKFEERVAQWDISPARQFGRYRSLDLGGSVPVSITFWEYTDHIGSERVHQVIIFSPGAVGRYTVPAPTVAGWRKIICPVADFVSDSTPINLAQITNMQLWTSTWNTPGGSVYIDDLRVELIEEEVVLPPYQLDSFDDFAATGWYDERNTGLMIQGPNSIEGTGSMQFKYENFAGLYDAVAVKIFSPALDLTNYQGYAMSLWILSDLVNDSRLNQIIIYDNAGHIGRYTVPKPQQTGWSQVIAPLSNFVWDNGVLAADVNWNKIGKLNLWMSCYPVPGNSVFIDDMWILDYVPAIPSSAYVTKADKATITVDGNASDWAGLSSDVVNFDLASVPVQPNGNLNVDYRMAWDDDYLYVLVQELPGDQVATEAANLAAMNDGAGGDILYDSLALYFDFTNNSLPGTAEGIDLWLIIGLASQGQNDLLLAWTNGGWGPHDPNALDYSQYAAAGSLGSRVVEARISWSALDAAINPDRLPDGGLVANVGPGMLFGADPRLADLENSWDPATAERGAAWFNGTLWSAQPNGNDVFSVDVKLICSPSDLNNDCVVDLADYAVLADYWITTPCDSLNDWCSGADFDQLGAVNTDDLKNFAAGWLE